MGFFNFLTNFIKKNISLIILLLIFIFALTIRIIPSYDTVFSDPINPVRDNLYQVKSPSYDWFASNGVKYTPDDGIYHMRLVENMLLGGSFPFRIYFDAFTNFPHGTYIHFTPLYDWIIASVIWIGSLGKPTLETINQIAPFVPAVMGSLVVFLVYFLTKALFKNKATALLAAFLSATSHAYLYRSVLGNTDHHVAEIFFSTMAMMFLIFALKNRKEKNIQSFNLKKETKTEKSFWFFAVLTGFSLGLYFLAWTGATMFLFLIFCFIVFYYLLEYFLKIRQNWLLWLGMTIFLISFLMILPFFGHPDLFHTYLYNIVHLLAFGMGFLTFTVLILLDKLFLNKKINPKLMPLALVTSLTLVFLILKMAFPVLFDSFVSGIKEVNTGMVEYSKARELISEMSPASYDVLAGNFKMIFIVSLISLLIITYKFYQKRNILFFLIWLWAWFIMAMSGVFYYFGQNRFICYLSPVFAILSAYLIIEMFNFGGSGLQKAKELSQDNPFKKYVEWGSAVIVLVGLYFLVYPFPFNLAKEYPYSLPYILQDVAVDNVIAIAGQDRYELVEWLKNYTPDTGLDYYQYYKETEMDNSIGRVMDYQYPDTAYGILSVWDIGHMITYYSHRIPVANPFQQGIGRKNADGTITPGYATFFIEQDEQKADKYLEQLRVKYVIADSFSADSDNGYQQMIKWQQDELTGFLDETQESIDMQKYYNSMIAKLALFDASQTSFETSNNKESFNIKALSHFRLLYESDTTNFTLKIANKNDIKSYKVFEYVKGAVLQGKAKTGTEVEISVKIITNQGRTFVYKNTVVAKDNHFEIVVPYSTGYQEQSNTIAENYEIKIANYTKQIEVSEENILEGQIIKVN